MTVPAESTLHVINRTGHDARLELAGTPKGIVPENGAVEVLFRRGTTPVLLTPDCSGSDEPVPMLVTTMPSAPVALSNPAPDGSDATVRPSIVAGSSLHSASGSALPGTRSPGSRPARTTPHSVRGLRGPGDEPRTAQARTSGGAAAELAGTPRKIKGKLRRTSPAGDPTFAGMPPGERRTLLPVDRGSVAGPAGAEAVGSTAATSPGGLAGADSGAPTSAPAGAETAASTASTTPGGLFDDPAAVPAAEPVASIEPMRTGRPIGLLGLTAMVCVLGVLIAAIRAIVSQRAFRSNLA
jgi:hypothetical protein